MSSEPRWEYGLAYRGDIDLAVLIREEDARRLANDPSNEYKLVRRVAVGEWEGMP